MLWQSASATRGLQHGAWPRQSGPPMIHAPSPGSRSDFLLRLPPLPTFLHTLSSYLMVNGVALLAISQHPRFGLGLSGGKGAPRYAGMLIGAGAITFSGSIFLLLLDRSRWVAHGGALLLTAAVALTFAALCADSASSGLLPVSPPLSIIREPVDADCIRLHLHPCIGRSFHIALGGVVRGIGALRPDLPQGLF